MISVQQLIARHVGKSEMYKNSAPCEGITQLEYVKTHYINNVLPMVVARLQSIIARESLDEIFLFIDEEWVANVLNIQHGNIQFW